jgi:hypothetical protein
LLCLLAHAHRRARVETLAELFELHAKTPAQVRKGLEPLRQGRRRPPRLGGLAS